MLVHSCSWKLSWPRSLWILQLLEETFLPPADLGNISSGSLGKICCKTKQIGQELHPGFTTGLSPHSKAVNSITSGTKETLNSRPVPVYGSPENREERSPQTWKNCSCFSRLQKKGCLSTQLADGRFWGSMFIICSIKSWATMSSARKSVQENYFIFSMFLDCSEK